MGMCQFRPDQHFTEVAVKMIQRERRKQDEKWGEQNHPLNIWLMILMEEVGEFSKEILELNFAIEPAQQEADLIERRDRVKNELIQVAAVSQAMLEYILRQERRAAD